MGLDVTYVKYKIKKNSSFFFNRELEEKTKIRMERLCNIWKERGVFDADFVEILKANIRKGEF